MATYSIIYNNREVGPMHLEQLRAYNVTPNTMIRVDNGPWVEAYTLPEVMQFISQNRPAYSPQSQGFAGGQAPSSGTERHIVAGILALLIGTLGIQYFYIGKTSAGLLTILLSIVTCGFWGIITFIQGILMLTMSEADFERKYVYSTSTLPLF